MTTVVTIAEPTTEVTISEQTVAVNVVQSTTEVTIQDGVRTFANLSDTLFTDLQDNDVPTYDIGTGKWINAPQAGGAGDVTDLTTTTGDENDMLRVANGGGLEYRTAAQVLSDIGAETAGAAATVQGNLNTHTSDTANPHGVTASQLSLVIGTDVQAYSGNLDDIAGLSPGAGEDGYSIVWDNDTSAFVLVEVTGGGGGAWGAITGTLSDQTDLQTALDAKVDLAGDTMTGNLTISKTTAILDLTGGGASRVRLQGLDAISGSSSSLMTIGSGFNLSSFSSEVAVRPTTATTAATTRNIEIYHQSSGTPAAGFGTDTEYWLHSSTNTKRRAAGISALWQTATDASRKADLVLRAWDTSEREGLRIRATGTAPAIGFLGATPVARAAHIADAAGDDAATVNAILVVLENLGFIATS